MPAQAHATIKDIAAAAGVGITTVSRALNNQPGVSKTTRAKVLAAAEDLNYRPNLFAKNLRSMELRTIAVLVKGPSNPFFQKIYDFLEAGIRQRGFRVSLVRIPHDGDEYAEADSLVASYKPSGIVFLGGGAALARHPALRIPHVLCTSGSGPEIPSVSVDDRKAMLELVTYLNQLGHRRIALLGGETDPGSVGLTRESCFIAAMRARGLDPDPALILHGSAADDPYSFEYGYQLTGNLAASGADFTALVAVSDVLAVGAMRALHEAGTEVPGHVSVTGFDGIEMGRYITPALTTYVQPAREMAEMTVTALFALMEGKKTSISRLLPGSMSLGESTGPAPGATRR